MNSDLVSIIIPVYNVEKFLRDCLESVTAQTYGKYEVILVDDGSTDSSAEICKEYCSMDSRFKLIRKENGGASSARNAGLEQAVGEYIYFLDSDDWLEKDTLETLINCAKKEAADVVFCEAYAINEKTDEILTKNYSYHDFYQTGIPHEQMKAMVKNKEFHVVVWLLLLKREMLMRNHLAFIEGIMYEDAVFTYQVFCLAERAAHVHRVLYNRRYRDDSVMTSKKSERNFYSALRAYEEIVKFSESLPEGIESKEFIARCAYNVLNNYRALEWKAKKKYKQAYNQVKEDILQHNAFGDRALRMRCHGYVFWISYKILQKTVLRGQLK